MEKTEKDLRLESRDIETIRRFFNHFNLPTPDYLTSAMHEFSKNQNLETERALILALTSSVVEVKGQIVELDDMFGEVSDACANISYNMQFDKDFEDIIADDGQK